MQSEDLSPSSDVTRCTGLSDGSPAGSLSDIDRISIASSSLDSSAGRTTMMIRNIPGKYGSHNVFIRSSELPTLSPLPHGAPTSTLPPPPHRPCRLHFARATRALASAKTSAPCSVANTIIAVRFRRCRCFYCSTRTRIWPRGMRCHFFRLAPPLCDIPHPETIASMLTYHKLQPTKKPKTRNEKNIER